MADRELKIRLSAEDRASGVLRGLGDTMRTAIGVAIGTVIVPALKALGRELGSFITEAAEAERVSAQLNAVLESTGGIAGVTANMANELATAISQVTKFDDEAVISAEALMLTFTNIGQNVFPAAITAATDMATVLGTDLDSTVRQLGRALNDPLQGLQALTRLGVQFSEEQKNVIKAMVATGDVAGAQTLILDQLTVKFGGAAVAAGKTFAGQLAILKNSVGNLKEAIGGALIPILTGLAREFSGFVQKVTPAVGSAVQLIINAFSSLGVGAEGWGARLGQSFANGLARALPYIVGVIRAIGQVIAYWFKPSSPPKIAEDIEEWGASLVRMYFAAFSSADLSPIMSFANQLGSLLSDALGVGIIDEAGATGLLAPVKAALGAIEGELQQTGKIGEAAFTALRVAGGLLGPQIERAAREFFKLEDAGSSASSAVDAVSSALEEAKAAAGATTGGAGGGGGGGDPVAIADALAAQFTTGLGAPAGGGTFGLDVEGISAQADSIAKGITDALFPIIDNIKLKWAGVTAFITKPLQLAKDWIDLNWPKVTTALNAIVDPAAAWLALQWDTGSKAVSAAVTAAAAWLGLQWETYAPGIAAYVTSVGNWLALNWTTAATAISGYMDSAAGWFALKWATLSPGLDTYITNVSDWLALAWTNAGTALSTYWPIVTKWLTTAWQTLAPNFSTYVAAVRGWLDLAWTDAKTALNTYWPLITKWIGTAWDTLAPKFSTYVAAVRGWLELSWAEKLAPFSDFVAKAKEWVGLVWTDANSGFADFKTTFQQWTGVDFDLLTGGLEKLATAAGKVLDLDWSAIKITFEEGGLSGAATEIVAQLKVNLEKADWSGVAQAIMNGIGTATVGWTGALATMASNLNAEVNTPEGQKNFEAAGRSIALALIGTIAGAFGIASSTETGEPVYQAVADNLWRTMQKVPDTMRDVAGSILKGLIGTLVEVVLGDEAKTEFDKFWTPVWESVSNAFSPALMYESLREKALAATQLIVDLLLGKQGGGAEGGSGAGGPYEPIGIGIVAGIAKGIGLPTTLAELIAAVKQLFADLYNWVTGKEGLDEASPSQKYVPVGEEIVNGLILGIGNRVAALILKAQETIDSLLLNVKTWLGIASESTVYTTIGEEIVNGLIAGIGNKYEALKLKAKETLDLFLADVKTFLGIASGSTVYAAVGVDLVQGLIDGIGSMIGSLSFGLRTTVESARLALLENGPAGVIAEFMATGARFVDFLYDGVTSGTGGFTQKLVSWLIQAVRDTVAAAAGALTGGGGGAPSTGSGWSGGGTTGGAGGGTTGKITPKTGARAWGGSVLAGGAYMVGEGGPELFVPRQSGSIVPNVGTRIGVNIEQLNIHTSQSGTRVIDDIRYLQMLGAMA